MFKLSKPNKDAAEVLQTL